MHLFYSNATPLRPLIRHLFWVLAFCISLCQPVLAYTLTCDVQGSFPELEKISIEPASVKVEITSIGDHLYIKMDGPKPVNIKAIKDVQRYGKKLKFFVTGPCQLPPG